MNDGIRVEILDDCHRGKNLLILIFLFLFLPFVIRGRNASPFISTRIAIGYVDSCLTGHMNEMGFSPSTAPYALSTCAAFSLARSRSICLCWRANDQKPCKVPEVVPNRRHDGPPASAASLGLRPSFWLLVSLQAFVYESQ